MNLSAGRAIFGVVILFTLMACGGGGDSPAVTVSDSSLTAVNLGEQGTLKFAPDSLPAGTEIVVTEAEYPPLVTDLVAVGVAYRVETASEPTIPVEISMQIPAGKSPDDLVIIRVEDDGTITILQTELVNQRLVAFTPGFSWIMVAELREELARIKPKIIGPDNLPIGVAGQYQEDAMTGIPGLDRKWRIAGVEGELSVAEDPLGNSSATVKGLASGVVYLTVRFHIPGTPVYASARKQVNIIDTMDSFGEGLKLTVYGPALVIKEDVFGGSSELFDITARILNTDVTDVSRWDCKMLYPHTGFGEIECGSCTENCVKTFTLNNFFLDKSDEAILTFTAFASHNGLETFGEVTHRINTTQNKPVITALTGNTTSRLWTLLLSDVDFDVTASIKGGVPPYTYSWNLKPNYLRAFHTHEELSDQFRFSLRQPGAYSLGLVVSDSRARDSIEAVYPVNFMPQRDFISTFSRISGVPKENVTVAQDLTLGFATTGAYLIYDGQKADYAYAIDWGDGSELMTGYMIADNVVDGGSISKTHRYIASGNYQLRFYTAPGWFPDVEVFIRNMLGQNADPGIASVSISVVPATVALPQIQVTASVSSASEAGDSGEFLFTRSGDLSEPLTVTFAFSGSATPSTDFTVENNSQVTIAAGQSNQTLLITPRLDSNESEGEETVVLTIQAAVGYTLGSENSAVVTIADFVQAPTLVSIVATDNSAAERGLQTATFTVSRTGDLSKDLRVNLTREGSASYSTDFFMSPSFVNTTASIVIAAGETSKDFILTPRDDAVVEGEETVQLSISSSPFYEIGASGFATVFIVDRGQVKFFLDKVTFGKVEGVSSDLCGDILSCIHEEREASFHALNEYWILSNSVAEYTFDEVYTLNNEVLSDYTVNFQFATPPPQLTGGVAVPPLAINGEASGFITGWYLPRSFTYFVRNDISSWSPVYNYDGQALVLNSELPLYDEVSGQRSGSWPVSSTTYIQTPDRLQQDFVIGGRFGWDPPLFIQWFYKLEQ